MGVRFQLHVVVRITTKYKGASNDMMYNLDTCKDIINYLANNFDKRHMDLAFKLLQPPERI